MRPYVPAVAPPPAGMVGRCRWCVLSTREGNLREPFAVVSAPAFVSPPEAELSATGVTAVEDAVVWALVPKRHVPVLTELPAAEMVSVLAGLVRASRDLARLSGGAEVEIVPQSLADGDAPKGASELSGAEVCALEQAKAKWPRRRGHVRFYLVPRRLPEPGLGPLVVRQGWPMPSSSIA